MQIAWPPMRHNYLAIVTAAVACFVFEVVWYSFFLEEWLEGIGHDRAWLLGTDVNVGLRCGTALLAAGLLAAAISGFTQLTGPLTAARGMKVAAGLWLGCVLTTWATANVFELRSYAHFALTTGFWLLAMAMMGAIVGAWKRQGVGSRE